VLKKLLEKNFVYFDGAIGSILQKNGLKPGQRPDIMNITAPDVVESIQRQYTEAGSEILLTNTLGANAHALKGTGYSVEEIIRAAVAVTKRACDGRALTALDIGPIGEFISPFGALSFDASYELYKTQVIAGEKAGADLVAIETMSDLMEVKAVILAAKENTSLPVFAMMTFDKSGRTFTGCRPESFAVTAERLGAAALGINCSLAPEDIYPIAEKLVACTSLPVIIKPNAGLPNKETGAYDVGPEAFARQMAEFAQLGVKIIGGCCGSTPAFIAALKKTYEQLKPGSFKRDADRKICTPLQVESVDSGAFDVSGVRKLGTTEETVDEALEQSDRGEKILRIWLPEDASAEQAASIVRGIQGQSDKPLHLFGGNAEALDAALRSVSGIAAVSCPGGAAAAIEAIAAKYGAVRL
jgi:5-methyltetrahydrofolate--homocysteine methyltransferase